MPLGALRGKALRRVDLRVVWGWSGLEVVVRCLPLLVVVLHVSLVSLAVLVESGQERLVDSVIGDDLLLASQFLVPHPGHLLHQSVILLHLLSQLFLQLNLLLLNLLRVPDGQ